MSAFTNPAYLLALGSLLIGGSLGDIFGERRVFAVGVARFGLFSLVCAVAPDIGVLIAGRAVQGAFGALLTWRDASSKRLAELVLLAVRNCRRQRGQQERRHKRAGRSHHQRGRASHSPAPQP